MSLPAHALTPRIVHVAVSIEATSFREGLGKDRSQTLEAILASEVASALAQQYPLVDWSVTGSAGEPAGRLTAAVIERQPQQVPPGVTHLSPEVLLEWRAEIGGRPLPMPSVFPQLLYSSTMVDRPLHDERGEFLALLREKIVGWAKSDTNQLRREYLRHVPLATSVVVPPGQQVVLIPVPWKQSCLGEKSVFRISYVGGGAGQAQRTRVMLSGLVGRLSDPLKGSTQSRVSECTRDGATIDSANVWQACVDPLSTDSPPSLRVSIDDYVYDANPDVSNGIVTDDF